MSPEVLQGAISYHMEAWLQSDIYSMALVLWEVLSRTDLTPGMFLIL